MGLSLDNNGPENGEKRSSRLSQEILSLRRKIADLESLELELTQAESALSASTGGAYPVKTSEQIQTEIKGRLGFFPPFLTPALDTPSVLESLWRQYLSAFHENPLPDLFKEKLSAHLARYCAVPYPIVTHSCNLQGLGLSAGQVLHILEIPAPRSESDLEPLLQALARAPHPLAEWPTKDFEFEENLLLCCTFSFLKPAQAEKVNASLRKVLGSVNYAHLIAFLAYTKTYHLWVEAHPEVSYETHPKVRDHFFALLREEPRLAEVFRNYYAELGEDRQRVEAEHALRVTEERYRELFENANDIVYTQDLEGNLTSLNKAAERITGYTRSEALKMKLIDFAAPEYADVAHRMMNIHIVGETPGTHELEILAKDGHRVALEVSTRPIFREGKTVAVQGIARDITERKRTEEALQQAKSKLEAWVNELEQRTREMTLLSEMADMLRACLTTEEAYTVIVRVAQQIFPVRVGALYVIAPSRNVVEAVAIWGNANLAERAFAPDECWALRRGRTHWVEDTRTGLLCKHLHPSTTGGYLCVPMMAQSEALGVLHLTQPENGRLTEAKQRLAVAMAEHIAMALSNSKLHETLRSQSIRDPLTGLFNRRFMEESLELELRRAARNQRPLGIIMLDLDHFKQFNDKYGHDAGDTLLRELGGLLQANIRGEDIACRYGGEEFTLILPEGSSEVIQQRADFLREAIKHLDVKYRSQPLGRVTISMGVAIFPEHGRTGESLLQAADAALYRSKEDGGDKVTTAR